MIYLTVPLPRIGPPDPAPEGNPSHSGGRIIAIQQAAADTVDCIVAAFDAWQAGLQFSVREFLEAILAGEVRCYALGRNCNSEFLIHRIPLAGFVDDFAEAGSSWHGLPVIAGNDLPPDAVVLNAVLHRRPHEALRRLRALSPAPVVIHYSDFTRLAPDRFPPMPFVAESRATFFGNLDGFSWLSRHLADAESQRTLFDVMLYRLTGDPAFTGNYRLRDADQYFDFPVRLPAAPVFVDGGAYCGETSEIFCRLHPGYGGVLLFEPNAGSLEKARLRLRGHADIRYLPYALGDIRERLCFDASAANASRICDSGGTSVEVLPLDEVADGPVHFIKFDLEGYEPRALAGSRRTILAHHPVLAICVYHHPQDFLAVPRTVLEIREDYRLGLRHYTEGWEETVMYFTPR